MIVFVGEYGHGEFQNTLSRDAAGRCRGNKRKGVRSSPTQPSKRQYRASARATRQAAAPAPTRQAEEMHRALQQRRSNFTESL